MTSNCLFDDDGKGGAAVGLGQPIAQPVVLAHTPHYCLQGKRGKRERNKGGIVGSR